MMAGTTHLGLWDIAALLVAKPKGSAPRHSHATGKEEVDCHDDGGPLSGRALHLDFSSYPFNLLSCRVVLDARRWGWNA